MRRRRVAAPASCLHPAVSPERGPASIDNGISINEIDLVQQFTPSGQQPQTTPTTITSLTSGGFLQITYEYRPVPEPA